MRLNLLFEKGLKQIAGIISRFGISFAVYSHQDTKTLSKNVDKLVRRAGNGSETIGV